ncbi:MAG: hypothetical protein RR685_08470, partial [Hungatella sp.]
SSLTVWKLSGLYYGEVDRMTIEESDIKMDTEGQPMILATGDVQLIHNLDSFLQDIRHEAITQEGELFFDQNYGWSLLDFAQCEYDEMLVTKIKQRIKGKLSERNYINEASIKITLDPLDNDNIHIGISFKIKNADVSYEVDLNIDGSEVIIND